MLTGTVTQTAAESGLSESGREMLAAADMADVTMTASADMFELGVKVQVLRKGTLFAQRANRLYELYRLYPDLDSIPEGERHSLEEDVFRAPLETIEAEVREFFRDRAPAELERAGRDPRHRMALVFRWYLGNSSHWPIDGNTARRVDYQIWCGPAIGSFNDWARGTLLEDPRQRTVAQIGLNLIEGAAMVTRAHQARSHGIDVPPESFRPAPRPLS